MISIHSVKNIVFEFFTISLTIFIIIFVYPLLITFFVPCWIYRCLISYFVRTNHEFGQILKGIDATSAGKYPYSNPDCVILPSGYFTDKLDISTVIEAVKENIIEPGYYPELRQKIVRKYGYHFWLTIENFKIEDHVRNLYPKNPNMQITRAQLNQESRKLERLPFDAEKSPWEIIVITNYIDDINTELKSVLMVRVQHCLMDGYSVYNFLTKLSKTPWHWIPKFSTQNIINTQKKYQKNILMDICNFVMLLALGPYHFLKMFVVCSDKHEFVKNVFKPDYKDVWLGQSTSALPKDRLVSLKNSYGVSMSALITTLFSQAIYKIMKKAQVKNLTKTMHCILSYPLSGHKDSLTNHFTIVRIPIQVYEDDPVKTLKSVEEEYRNLRNSVKPLVFFYVQKMVALAPIGLRWKTSKLPPTTFVLTNFPGPPHPTDIFGCQLKKINLCGKGISGTAFLLASVCICNDFYFDVGSPTCNLSARKDVDMLFSEVLEILNDFERRNLRQIKKLL